MLGYAHLDVVKTNLQINEIVMELLFHDFLARATSMQAAMDRLRRRGPNTWQVGVNGQIRPLKQLSELANGFSVHFRSIGPQTS